MLTPVISVQSLSTQRSATNGDYIVPRTNRKLESAADQTENVNLFHRQFQTLSQNIFIPVCLRLLNIF